MKTLIAVFAAALVVSAPAFARGGSHGGGHSHSSYSPGTGSSHESHSVHGYVKKDGTYVAPHQQSDPDHRFENNWTTKGNQNPYTGADGTRVTPPGRQ